MGQGFFVGVRHASNHNDESFQTSALESRLDQVKHESEQLRLNILEKDKIIDGKADATEVLHLVMNSGSKSRVRVIVLGFGSSSGYNLRVILIRLPSGFRVLLVWINVLE